MSGDCVIADANIAFKGLAAWRGDLRDRIGPGGRPLFFTPRFLFVELFKHQERLVRAGGLPEEDLPAGLQSSTDSLNPGRDEFYQCSFQTIMIRFFE